MMTVRMTVIASAAVMTMWLVTVKKYGTSPSTFRNSTNMKSENTKGKNCIPSLPALSRSMLATNS